jgi:hypothetical protein
VLGMLLGLLTHVEPTTKPPTAAAITPPGLADIVKDDVPIIGDPGARRGSNLGRSRVG